MMWSKPLLGIIALAVPISSSAASVPRRFAVTHTSSSTALAIRGGAGPLPVEETAKAATAILFGQALYTKLAPKKTLEAWGMTASPLLQWTNEGQNDCLLGFAVASALLFFKDTSINTAIGAGWLVLVLTNVKTLLNETPKELGFPEATGGQFFNLIVNAFLSYTLLTDASYAETVLKAYCAYFVGIGALCALMPEVATKTWNLGAMKDNQKVKITIRLLGNNVAAFGVLMGSLALGKSPSQAFGLAIIPLLLSIINMNFLVQPPAFEKGPLMFVWLAMMATWIVTLAV